METNGRQMETKGNKQEQTGDKKRHWSQMETNAPARLILIYLGLRIADVVAGHIDFTTAIVAVS
jgi:hypothetical protein